MQQIHVIAKTHVKCRMKLSLKYVAKMSVVISANVNVRSNLGNWSHTYFLVFGLTYLITMAMKYLSFGYIRPHKIDNQVPVTLFVKIGYRGRSAKVFMLFIYFA